MIIRKIYLEYLVDYYKLYNHVLNIAEVIIIIPINLFNTSSFYHAKKKLNPKQKTTQKWPVGKTQLHKTKWHLELLVVFFYIIPCITFKAVGLSCLCKCFQNIAPQLEHNVLLLRLTSAKHASISNSI